MTEAYPSDNELLNMVSDTETGVEYIATGTAPYYLQFRKLIQRLILACRRTNDGRIYSEGGLDIGVKACKFWVGSQLVSYPGTWGVALADNKAAIYVNSTGTLVTTEYSAFPDMTTTAHLRLAVVTTAGGGITNIVDARDEHILKLPDGAGGIKRIIEAHVSSDTLTVTESGSVHTNGGATGTITLNLPANAVSGTWFTFAVQAAQQLRIDPGSKSILDECGQTADKYKYCSAIGATITLVADLSGNWVTTAKNGTWSQEA